MEGEIATLQDQMKLLFQQKQQQMEDQQQMLRQLKSSLEEKMDASYQGIKDFMDKQLQEVKGDLEAQAKDSRRRIEEVDDRLVTLDYKAFKAISRTQNALADLEVANRYENEDIYKGLQALEMKLQIVKEECQHTHGASDLVRNQQPASVRKKTTPKGQAGIADEFKKLSLYDGKTSLEAYLSEFETISQVNGWDEKQRGEFLAVSLSGPAQEILQHLPSEKRQSYPDLVKALSRQFRPGHRAELARAHFRSNRKQKLVIPPDFVEDLKTLAEIAYQEGKKETEDALAKEGQSDMEGSWKVPRPKNLQEAIEFTKEIETFLAETRKGRGEAFLQEAFEGIEEEDEDEYEDEYEYEYEEEEEEEEEGEEKPDPYLPPFSTDKKDPPEEEELGACAKP
ncbi:DNA ligase 1-like [Podarcis raffonei]|uniref:DNA ligase 1-like n=1 Tax=Podarcis raffonei TaxID=65483 RepID=UPI0023292351|nr:DNA ligase 1-like [Podarcis raffonei]